MNIDEAPRCEQCAVSLTGQAVGGLCANCLLKLALEPPAEPTMTADEESGRTVIEPTVTREAVGSRIGRYKLLQEIGEGGFGIVYLADQTEPVKRRVALKVLKPGMDTREVIARFEAERQSLALMDHPNIARIFDGGATESGRPYFVMELVKGIPLTKYCDDQQLNTRQRLDLFLDVLAAVQHAHQKGIIHRDLKPANILVSPHDGRPVIKVIDFGIAKAISLELTDKTLFTAVGRMIGTPQYMSPEQAEINALDVDTRSDIYSLGVVLYELLTGRTPLDAKKLRAAAYGEIQRLIREDEPTKPSTVLKQERTAMHQPGSVHSALRTPHSAIDQDLDWIVMKALEKDRSRRYETANGFAADLKRHLNNEPVVARPPSATYRFQKAFRRNRLVFTAATAVAVVLVAGIGVSTWQLLEAQSARKVAETEQDRADDQARRASESQQQSLRLLYASDMNLAQQALKLNNLGRARRLLERHRPQPDEEDLRGWEWRYLWQLTRNGALVTLTNRPTRGYSVSFSPDGTRLAVGWYNGQVDLWDVPGRRLIRALTDRANPQTGQVAFSPVHNLLAATSEPKVVTLYDFDSGRESILWRAPDQGAWDVRDLAFSQDGSRVVVYAGSTRELGDAVWVLHVSSSRVESHHPTVFSRNPFAGAARLSADNRRLYLARSDGLNFRYNIQCLDLATRKELWQTESQKGFGLTTLAVSPDGRVLASGSGFEDPTIRIWDAATGRHLVRLDGHTAWVCDLLFTRGGGRLISAASDQSIRFWDTSTWTETKVLRGHTDEVHAVSFSEPAQLIASGSKDGNLMLWKEDGKSAADGYQRLPENLDVNQVLPLDQSRVLLLPPGRPPEVLDLTHDSPPLPLSWVGTSENVLGCFGDNILCNWNGTNQMLVSEQRGGEFIQRGAVLLDSGTRPNAFTYNPTRQILAWTEGPSSTSVFLTSLTSPGRRIELKSDVSGLGALRFSEDGVFLAATARSDNSLRAWNIESGQMVASVGGRVRNAAFASGGRVLVAAIEQGEQREIGFYDLAHPDWAPRRVAGRDFSRSLAVSTDGGLVASSTDGGLVRLFDPARGELIEDLHGHLNAAFGIAFSANGRRLISASGGREAVKLWDIPTRQELLTLGGTGSALFTARWSDDGNVILAGAPWQAWSAPSWAEIAAAEANEKKNAKSE